MSAVEIEQPAVAEEDLQPVARVNGQLINELPQDLYIPPDALEVILEAFQGPLDLLLYLIRRQNLDILNIPVAKITEQYMHYIEIMQVMKIELAGEYLLMAAMLAEIKSRMLLPRQMDAEGDEDDPRAELVRRLQEYERFKLAAEDLDQLPRVERDVLPVTTDIAVVENEAKPLPQIELKELLLAMQDVLERVKHNQHHHVQLEPLSVRERMSTVLHQLSTAKFLPFTKLFTAEEGRIGVVVTFIAILELLKQSTIEIVQTESYGPIHVKVLE